MMRASIAAFSLSALLAGCTNEAADLGRSPPVLLASVNRELVFAPHQPNGRLAWRARLKHDIAVVSDGERQAVRAHIVASSAREAETLRRALVGNGIDPSRITATAPPPPAREASVLLTRAVAGTPDCADAITPAFGGDPLPSLMSLATCTQSSNLAAMLVDPADLVAPPRLAPSDGAYLAAGVTSWRANRRTGEPSVDTTGASPDAGGGSASGGSTSAAAPTTSTAASTGNTIATPAATVTTP
ncbi:CpaD family pilus assembly lipoprotein [Lichenihabitans psoromatis]|uniref:CpaD family pilus assembly lipoprotein n=1 Tax=Lichenihabitans psoromatis TaxID=2528642 RepID=UPI0010361E7F|nr:CpaD family pilus assembly lipoprotein [Lichenihabitans psoromatis]